MKRIFLSLHYLQTISVHVDNCAGFLGYGSVTRDNGTATAPRVQYSRLQETDYTLRDTILYSQLLRGRLLLREDLEAVG